MALGIESITPEDGYFNFVEKNSVEITKKLNNILDSLSQRLLVDFNYYLLGCQTNANVNASGCFFNFYCSVSDEEDT